MLFIKYIKKNSKNIIIISEKKNNLYFFIKKFNLFLLNIKIILVEDIQFLSEVGLFQHI